MIRMDGVRRKSLKELLGLTSMVCCGATLGISPTNDEELGGPLGPEIQPIDAPPIPIEAGPDSHCVRNSPAAAGMNLGAALAAERQLRALLDSDSRGAALSPSQGQRPNSNEESSPSHGTGGTVPGTPARLSLMRLLEEEDICYGEMKKEGEGVGCDSVCCVCMGRKKGAAFIPCGHTFCRVCSRELWLNRGSCPLCNRLVLEILDTY